MYELRSFLYRVQDSSAEAEEDYECEGERFRQVGSHNFRGFRGTRGRQDTHINAHPATAGCLIFKSMHGVKEREETSECKRETIH